MLLGFAIGASLALVFAAWVGLSREAEAYLEPTFAGLRSIPSLAWVPLLLLWLGIDETSKVVLIAIGAFFPVYLNGVAAIRDIDRKLVEVGQMYGFSRRRLVRRVLLPAALPGLFTGLRSGLSLAWMFLVAAELIAATKGLGYLLERWAGNLATRHCAGRHYRVGAAGQDQRRPARGAGETLPRLARHLHWPRSGNNECAVVIGHPCGA